MCGVHEATAGLGPPQNPLRREGLCSLFPGLLRSSRTSIMLYHTYPLCIDARPMWLRHHPLRFAQLGLQPPCFRPTCGCRVQYCPCSVLLSFLVNVSGQRLLTAPRTTFWETDITHILPASRHLRTFRFPVDARGCACGPGDVLRPGPLRPHRHTARGVLPPQIAIRQRAGGKHHDSQVSLSLYCARACTSLRCQPYLVKLAGLSLSPSLSVFIHAFAY